MTTSSRYKSVGALGPALTNHSHFLPLKVSIFYPNSSFSSLSSYSSSYFTSSSSLSAFTPFIISFPPSLSFFFYSSTSAFSSAPVHPSISSSSPSSCSLPFFYSSSLLLSSFLILFYLSPSPLPLLFLLHVILASCQIGTSGSISCSEGEEKEGVGRRGGELIQSGEGRPDHRASSRLSCDPSHKSWSPLRRSFKANSQLLEETQWGQISIAAKLHLGRGGEEEGEGNDYKLELLQSPDKSTFSPPEIKSYFKSDLFYINCFIFNHSLINFEIIN